MVTVSRDRNNALIILFLLLTTFSLKAQQNTISLEDTVIRNFYDADKRQLSPVDSNLASYYQVIQYVNGNIYGPVTTYYRNGKPCITGRYQNNNISAGNENGEFVYYYENGNVFQVQHFVKGLLEGSCTEYYPSGKPKASASYLAGKRYGCEYAWDESGQLISKGFFENGKLTPNTVCDSVKDIAVTAKYNDLYNKEFPEGDYQVFNDRFYYKSSGLKVLAIAITNDQNEDINFTNFKPGQHFYLRIRVTGLTSLRGKFKYILAQAEEDIKGHDYGSTGDVNDENELDPLEVMLGGGIGSIPSGYPREFYFSFKIKDKNSPAYIHGYFAFRIGGN